MMRLSFISEIKSHSICLIGQSQSGIGIGDIIRDDRSFGWSFHGTELVSFELCKTQIVKFYELHVPIRAWRSMFFNLN